MTLSILAAALVTQGLFEGRPSEYDGWRTQQAKQLEAYVARTAADPRRLAAIWRPDFRSPGAYESSVASYRRKFADSIGYPPPEMSSGGGGAYTEMGEDDLGVYYRARFAVALLVESEGIYIVPKGASGRIPLVIAMHGGGGSPEVALFHGGSNYHDMVRGGVKLGYAVYAPQHLFNAPGYPADVRNRIDRRLRMVGTTLMAMEIAKISRAIDVLSRRPEIDARRIAMVGLSYGGFYSIVTPALDTRISVVVSSCYFGIQEFRYALDDLSVPSDFQTPDRFTLFRDSEVASLICPRALLIQAGSKDDDAHREGGVRLAPIVAENYRRLGRADDFKFLIFDGGHEFHDASAWEWVERRFGRPRAGIH